MSVDKLVDSTQLDSDLTDVADEIRTAGGTLLPLSFPDDYVVAIGDIGNTEIKTASGSIAHFEDALARKAQSLTVAIEPVQSGSGDPSPDNVRPISGWTGANVTRTGKNLNPWDGVNFTADTHPNGFWLNAGSYVFSLDNGGEFGAGNSIYIKLKDANGNVITKGNIAGTGWYLNSTGQYYYGHGENGKTSAPFELLTDCFFCFGFNNTKPTANGVQLEVGSTATSYEPYNADTYSITFPSEAGTVYGGTLDVTTGKLTVDRAMVDLGTLTWTSISNNRKQCTELTNSIAKPSSTAEMGNLIAERYANVNASDLFSDSSLIGISVNIGGYLIARTSGEEVSGKLCYPLATPIVYDLTPTEVTTLLGTNNVWGDTGDSTIKYIAPKAQIPSAQGVYF